jgi:hypothetical protein
MVNSGSVVGFRMLSTLSSVATDLVSHECLFLLLLWPQYRESSLYTASSPSRTKKNVLQRRMKGRHCRPRDRDGVGCVQDSAVHLPEARWCWQHILPDHFYNITNIACWYRHKICKLATWCNQVPEENKFIFTFRDNIQPRRYPVKLIMRNNGANEMYQPIDYLTIASV